MVKQYSWFALCLSVLCSGASASAGFDGLEINHELLNRAAKALVYKATQEVKFTKEMVRDELDFMSSVGDVEFKEEFDFLVMDGVRATLEMANKSLGTNSFEGFATLCSSLYKNEKTAGKCAIALLFARTYEKFQETVFAEIKYPCDVCKFQEEVGLKEKELTVPPPKAAQNKIQSVDILQNTLGKGPSSVKVLGMICRQ